MKDRPLRSVLADFDGARKQTLRVLEGLTDQEAAKPTDWLQGRSLADYIAAMTLDHEREHLEELHRWRDRREAGSAPNGSKPQSD
jgi:hypothetical protein